MTKKLRILAALLTLGLVAAACSSGEVASTAPTSTPATETPATETPATATQAEVTPTTETSEDGETTTSTTDEDSAGFEWDLCEGAFGNFDCGTIQVPLDYSSPDGEQIDIAIARIAASGPAEDVIGPLVFNPGGPGFGGIESLEGIALTLPFEITERFDLVTFDPRGTGTSAAVDCDNNLDDAILTIETSGDDDGWQSIVDATAEGLSSCSAATLDLAPHLGTMNVARDIDLIREAIGAETINYLGYSYGTRLGATYAELFPGNIRAMVLDAAVRPNTDWALLAGDQAAGLDSALQNFAGACDADPDCPLQGTGPALETINSLRENVAEQGSLPTLFDQRVLTLGEFDLAIISALYSKTLWQTLATGLADAEATEDGTELHFLTDSYAGRSFEDDSYSSGLVANSFINCADDANRPTADEQRALSEASAEQAGFFAPAMRAGAGCLGIPESQSPLEIGTAADAPPIVIIGNTGDPATPYEWSVELDEFLTNSVLYTVEAEGHTAYGSIECVQTAIDAYLIDLELPEKGAGCSDNATADFFYSDDFDDFDLEEDEYLEEDEGE